MIARALAVFAALGLLASAAHAQSPAKMQYRVSTGGLLAGTFTSIEIPQMSIAQNGADTVVVLNAGPKDGRKVSLTAGTVKEFTYKKLQVMEGQQMTVKISIVPVDTAPGKRCRIILDGAKLDKVTPESISFKPSETPEFKCS